MRSQPAGLTAIVSLICGALVACSKTPPRPLGDAVIPPGFTFATTRGVELNVAAEEALVSPTGVAAIEVKLPDGKLLFRGPVRSGIPLRIRLAVPTKDDHLRVSFLGGAVQRATNIAIANGVAAHTFR
jgi:hypothetical protein